MSMRMRSASAIAPLRRRAAWGRPPLRPQGMTLVDLMVGMAIGLFLMAVMGAVYQGTRTTFVAQESGARIQENGRFAMDTIAADLRMSGFRGCRSTGAPDVNNTLNLAATLPYNYAQQIWGSRSAAGAWSPALSAPASTLAPSADGDVLVVRKPVGLGWSLIGEQVSVADPLSVTPTANFALGDLLMVADCAGADVLQATNATPGLSGSIAHVAGAGGVAPGVSTTNLSRVYAQDARVWRLQTVVYFLAASLRQPGQTALWSHTLPVYDGSEATKELVTGVERLAITYGVDTDGDGGADRLQSAAAVTDWAQVVSARVEMVVSGSDTSQTATIAQTYVFNGASYTPSDRRRRAVMSTVVSLRNAVP